MNRIALIFDNTILYWSSIILTLAAAAAVCIFIGLYLRKTNNWTGAFLYVPLALVLSTLMARLLHWYCRPDSYDSLLSAITVYSTGSYALLGVFAGCGLSAVVLRCAGIIKNLPEMLDCLCIAGSAGIGVGRLASFFDTMDRGFLVSGDFPLLWVSAVVNSVSGAMEYRFATFLVQSIIALLLFVCLLFLYIRGDRQGRDRDGDCFLIFLLIYGASEVIMDSTRYDSLFFRSNGFVSIVQVVGALALGASLLVFSLRMVKNRGFRMWYGFLWTLLVALIAVSGYMEYHVQRHGDQVAFAYGCMGSGLVGIVAIGLTMWILGGEREVPGKMGKTADIRLRTLDK